MKRAAPESANSDESGTWGPQLVAEYDGDARRGDQRSDKPLPAELLQPLNDG
jgi:hypothetical protein